MRVRKMFFVATRGLFILEPTETYEAGQLILIFHTCRFFEAPA